MTIKYNQSFYIIQNHQKILFILHSTTKKFQIITRIRYQLKPDTVREPIVEPFNFSQHGSRTPKGKPRNTKIIVDGNVQKRSYNVLRTFTIKTDTQVVYVFYGTLRKIIIEHKIDKIVITWDGERVELYVQTIIRVSIRRIDLRSLIKIMSYKN